MNFDPFNVFFLPNTEDLMLYKKTVPLTNEYQGNLNDKIFPNLAFICDDSGSMDWNPDTGTGNYDALIITIYSLLKWLKNKAFASVIEYNFTFFSSTTRSTGWIDYFHLDDMKKLLYSPEQGGTILNPAKFEEIINDLREKAIILITDGEIFNYKELIKKFNQISLKPIFLFIQIGKLSKFAKFIASKGYQVVQINNIKKLKKIVLDFIKEAYQELE